MSRADHPLRAAITAAEQTLARLGAERDALLVEMVTWEKLSYRDAGEVFGLSAARVGQIIARHRERYPASADTPAQRARMARDAFEAARHAQDLREEAASGGNESERLAFYGSIHQSPADDVETRVGLREWREMRQAYGHGAKPA